MRLPSPHAVLALAAVVAVAIEPAVQFGRRHDSASAHVVLALGLLVRAATAAGALLYAWRKQDRLRLVPLLLVGLMFQVAWISMHLAIDVKPDQDLGFYRHQGQTLLDGDYPRSEYPTGAVLLFAVEDWLGGARTGSPTHSSWCRASWRSSRRSGLCGHGGAPGSLHSSPSGH